MLNIMSVRIQIKATMRFYYIATTMSKVKKLGNAKFE